MVDSQPASGRAQLELSDLSDEVRAAPVQLTAADVAFTANGIDFDALVAQFEHGLLRRALDHAGGNRRMAADLLKIKRTTLIEKLKRLERS